MIFSGGPLYIINTILCFLINLFCYLVYKKNKQQTTLNIGIAFGLFGISHIMTFLGLREILNLPLLAIRLTAYFTIIATIYREQKKISFKLITLLSIIVTSIFYFFIPQILSLLSMSKETFNVKVPIDTLLNITNLALCIFIAFIALLKYRKTRNTFLCFLGIGFGLFALSNLFQIITTNLGVQANFATLLAVSRIFSYLLIIAGIYLQITQETLNKIIKYTTNTKLQLSLIVMMILTLVSLFYYPNKQFLSTDPKPTINAIKPASEGKQIKEITAGLYVKNFSVFDIIKNNFIMNAILWFEFDPHQVNLETIKSFSFEKGKILEKSKIKSKIINDKLWVYYKIKVEFSSNLNYKLFPIEDHKIYITLANTNMNPNSEILVSQNTNLVVSKNIFTGDWNNIGKEVEYGYIEESLDKYQKEMSTKYPVVLFELSFEKAGIRKTLAIFLPLFMVFFLSMFSLLINIKNSAGILSLSVGSTSALIFNLIVIERMSPDVRYFTIANKIYSLLLVIAFTILLLNIYITKEMKNESNEKKLILERSYAFIFFIVFILLIIYSVLY